MGQHPARYVLGVRGRSDELEREAAIPRQGLQCLALRLLPEEDDVESRQIGCTRGVERAGEDAKRVRGEVAVDREGLLLPIDRREASGHHPLVPDRYAGCQEPEGDRVRDRSMPGDVDEVRFPQLPRRPARFGRY